MSTATAKATTPQPLAIERLCRNYCLTALAQIGVESGYRSLNSGRAIAWTVTLIFGKRSLTVPMFTAPRENRPSPASVLLYLLVFCQSIDTHKNVEDWAKYLNYDHTKFSTQLLFQHHKELLPKLKEFLGVDYQTFVEALD